MTEIVIKNTCMVNLSHVDLYNCMTSRVTRHSVGGGGGFAMPIPGGDCVRRWWWWWCGSAVLAEWPIGLNNEGVGAELHIIFFSVCSVQEVVVFIAPLLCSITTSSDYS